jgi:hypothetical protein
VSSAIAVVSWRISSTTNAAPCSSIGFLGLLLPRQLGVRSSDTSPPITFNEIVASGDHERAKPAPDPLLRAAERLGTEAPLCLALEDSHNGVRSASSAGMMTVMVPDLLEPTDELRNLCAFVACDLHEVPTAVLAACAKR